MKKCSFFVTIASLGMMTAALADYTGPPINPEIRNWFSSVKNSIGEVCCDETESKLIDDYFWVKDHFEVVIDGTKYKVNPAVVVTEANKYGPAMVWIYPKGSEVSSEHIRCFIRGQEG